MRMDWCKRLGLIGVSILFGIIGWSSISDSVSYADWAYYSPDEMAEMADLIVLGKVEGPIMEEKTAKSGHSGHTDWEVTVTAYLKHQGQQFEKIVVTTPGNRTNTGVSSSIDYSLDEKGSEILLFLEIREATLHPLNPGAVIAMEGQELHDTFKNEAEQQQLQKLLDKRERLAAERGTVSETYEQLMEESLKINKRRLSTNKVILVVAVIVFLVTVVTVLSVIYINRRGMR